MSLLLVIVLLVSSTLVAGDCNVYNAPLSRTIGRCHQIQDCVNKALFSNGNNRYVLDKVFRSTQPRPSVALIVNYHVTAFGDRNVVTDHDGSAIGSGADEIYLDTGSADGINKTTQSGEGGADEIYFSVEGNKTTTRKDENTTIREVSYIEQIGWSTTGIYKAIRPVILISLQPALYWWTLSFAIENYSFPKSIHLELNISNTTECDSLGVTRSEVREALEHLTMNVSTYPSCYMGGNSDCH